MSNNILQPISPDFNVYARENASVYFNATTPAPLSGQTNVTFQFDQFGNVSACVTASTAGGSVGTAGQIQKVGATAGSFAASGLTDDGTTITSSEVLSVPNGTRQAPAIGFTGFGTGMYSPGGGLLAFTIGTLTTQVDNSQQNSILDSMVRGWSGDPASQAMDAGISRVAANSIAFGNGGSGDATAAVAFGTLSLTNSTTASSATAGAATVLPVAPLGYVEISVNGTVVKVPYYTV